MKKTLISIMVILLMSACTPDQQDLTWNGLVLKTGTKCPAEPPQAGNCDEGEDPIVGWIKVDAVTKAPISVSEIQSCEGKKVTWKYEEKAFPKGDAPPFFIVFDPKDFPGQDPTKIPGSKPKPNRNSALNQELTINTRKMNTAPECLSYMIVSHKGVLDPVFIIKR